LPLTLRRVWLLANGKSPRAKAAATSTTAEAPQQQTSGRLTGEGETFISAPAAEVWRRLTDPQELAAIVPGCRRLVQDAPDRYSGEVLIGVAGIRGLYTVAIEMRDKREPISLRLVGKASGTLGYGSGEGFVTLSAEADGRTRLTYRYEASIGGKVAGFGQRMLGTVTRLLIAEFFRSLERRISPARQPPWRRWLSLLRGRNR
jgi:2-furoyl-CoA dehydrogenase large subunit